MRLLGSGFSTAATSFAGTTGGSAGTFDSAAPQGKGMRIQRVVAACGGTTAAPQSVAGMSLTYGISSEATIASLPILVAPSMGAMSSVSPQAAFTQTIDGLNIECNWFEVKTDIAAQGGWSVFVMGD